LDKSSFYVARDESNRSAKKRAAARCLFDVLLPHESAVGF